MSPSNDSGALPLPQYQTHTELDPSFEKDMRDTHIIYDYNVKDDEGNAEKWRYEMWFFSETRIVYSIHGGPMAGRRNYQIASYQCIRPGEIWQVNWLEETGTTISLVFDIVRRKITTSLSFSKGHWECPEAARGDKRQPKDFARWRQLAQVGKQTERFMLAEQADVVEMFKGKGGLVPILETDTAM